MHKSSDILHKADALNRTPTHTAHHFDWARGTFKGPSLAVRVQIVEVIEPEARERRLLELLKKYHSSRRNRVLVFVLYKKEASRVEERLNKAGWKVCTSSNALFVQTAQWILQEFVCVIDQDRGLRLGEQSLCDAIYHRVFHMVTLKRP